MLYPRRVHALRDVSDLDELAGLLTEHSWTLCTGFRFRAGDQVLHFLNDSTGEDSAQEYAVLAEDGRQLETITFGWCTPARAAELIRLVLAGDVEPWGHFELHIDPNPHHVCHLCR